MNNQREQAWQYFVMHANQRMSIFNFYISISLALVAGLGVLISVKAIPILYVLLGSLMIILSFVFWGLDIRTREFIHIAQDMIVDLEDENKSIIPIFNEEHNRYILKKFKIPTILSLLSKIYKTGTVNSSNKQKEVLKLITYTFLFGSIYILFILLGIAVILLSVIGYLK